MNIVISLTKEGRLQVQTKSNKDEEEDEKIYLSNYLQKSLSTGNNIIQELAKIRKAINAAQLFMPRQANKIGLAASEEMFRLFCAISTPDSIKFAKKELKRLGIPIPTKAS